MPGQVEKSKKSTKRKNKHLKIRRKTNDSTFNNVKHELKRLGNAYSDGVGVEMIVPELNPLKHKTFSGINWEEIAKNNNITKPKPVAKDSVLIKEKTRLIFNSSKQPITKVSKKEVKKLDSVKLVTIEFGSNTNYTQQEKEISQELDELLRDNNQMLQYEMPYEIETHSTCQIEDRKMVELESRVVKSSGFTQESDLVNEKQIYNTACKTKSHYLTQHTLNERLSNSKDFK